MQNEELKQAVKLTEEQIAKVTAAKTPAEVLALAKEEGVPLTDDQLETISGGVSWADFEGAGSLCPHCNHWGLDYMGDNSNGKAQFECPSCGNWCVEK